MAGWHHRLNGHESEQTEGDCEGQGSLVSMGSQRVRYDLVAEQQKQWESTKGTQRRKQFSNRQYLFRASLVAQG